MTINARKDVEDREHRGCSDEQRILGEMTTWTDAPAISEDKSSRVGIRLCHS